VPAFADDYAATALGLFTLYQATGEVRWYIEAMRLVEGMVDLFADPAGGFFTTGADVEAPLARKRDHFDSPSPSANALAAEALLLASLYTGDADLRTHSERALRAGATIAITSPSGAGHLLSVLHTTLSKPQEVAIVGPQAQDLASIVWERFRPGVALAVDRDGSATNIVPLLDGRATDSTLAYVCRDFQCALPVSDPEALRRLL